jgi:uncharacterized protein HemX
MSTQSTSPADPTPATPEAPATPETPAAPAKAPRDRGLVLAVLVAVVVAALAIGGLFFYRQAIDQRNADTEAAFARSVTDQGAEVDTVECDGDTCAAIIQGSAYTVLVQEDGSGEQHFGVVPGVGRPAE